MAYQEVVVKKPLSLIVLPYISLIVFFAVWQGVVQFGIIPNTLLASPSQVITTFIDKLTNANPDGATMGAHAWTSIQEAFLGYLLSLLVGIPLGLAMGWFNVVEGLFRPIFELIRPIPPIAFMGSWRQRFRRSTEAGYTVCTWTAPVRSFLRKRAGISILTDFREPPMRAMA